MEASFVVPGPLDMAWTRNRFADGVFRRVVKWDQPERRLASLAGLPNDEGIERLTTVGGFGGWSAKWFLARCPGRGDVCPVGRRLEPPAAAGGGA